MAFELINHEVLKKSLNESIRTLILTHHSHRTVDMNKLRESVVLLDDVRRTQAEFLLTMIELTDVMDVSTPEAVQTQARVLNAAAFYIRQKIESSYPKNYFLSFISHPDNSSLYASLTSSLMLTADNVPNNNALIDMYKDLRVFLCRHVYKQGDSRLGYLDFQVFSTVYNYKVTEDIKDLTKKISNISIALDTSAEKEHIKTERPVPSKGFFSKIFGSTATHHKPSSQFKDSEVDDYELRAKLG